MVKTHNNARADVQHNGHQESTAHTVREGLETARDLVVEGYEKVSSKAHNVWDNVADKNINDVTYSVQQYVRHHPGNSLLLAAGAGLVLGLALRWRRGFTKSK